MQTDPAGKAAPNGGFQQGGWYSGYQYYNGSFAPQAGMIHPQSSQQGAGQMVSSEVNRQSDAAQGLKPGTIDNYVAQQNNNPQNAGGGGYTGDGLVDPNAAPTSGSGAGVGFQAPVPIDLPGQYDALTKEAGINDLESGLAQKQQAFNENTSKINDNPFLSEGTRVGRIAKLTTDYNNDIKADQDTLAMKKADVQTKLDLQQKQYDINSQASQQSFNQFQSLLQSGALDNASGQDIANITKATGLSSSMVLSAVKAQAAKNVPTQVIQFDDGKNQGYAIINTKTGAVINKQVIGPSKPASSGSGIVNDERQLALDKAQAPSVLLQGAHMGKTLPDMMAYGASQGVSAADVYRIYSSVNYYHATPDQIKADKKKYGIK